MQHIRAKTSLSGNGFPCSIYGKILWSVLTKIGLRGYQSSFILTREICHELRIASFNHVLTLARTLESTCFSTGDILRDRLFVCFRWCPSFLAYLLTTLTSLWLLQLAIHEYAVGQLQDSTAVTQSAATTTTASISSVAATTTTKQDVLVSIYGR